MAQATGIQMRLLVTQAWFHIVALKCALINLSFQKFLSPQLATVVVELVEFWYYKFTTFGEELYSWLRFKIIDVELINCSIKNDILHIF